MLKIDGSTKSGSGTIVRYSVALASILRKDLHLFNIRQKREKRGLRPQHLKAVQACAEMCGGTIKGAEVTSQEIFYHPGKEIRGGRYQWDIGTAGSTTMLAQTVLPLACFADSFFSCEITGGLFQDFAPAAHHLQHVVFPLLKRMGIKAELIVKKPGYVPTGGGIIEIHVDPIKKQIGPLSLDIQGKITQTKGIALSSHLKERRVSERMMESCSEVLEKNKIHADISCVHDTTASQRGASLTVYSSTATGCIIGVDCAGKLGRTAEKIGQRVAKMLLEDIQSGATVDHFTADQLILYAALASGSTHYIVPAITDHVDTNLWLVQEILGAKIERKNCDLRIQGIGLER